MGNQKLTRIQRLNIRTRVQQFMRTQSTHVAKSAPLGLEEECEENEEKKREK